MWWSNPVWWSNLVGGRISRWSENPRKVQIRKRRSGFFCTTLPRTVALTQWLPLPLSYTILITEIRVTKETNEEKMTRKNSPSQFLWHVFSCKIWPIWIKGRYTSYSPSKFWQEKSKIFFSFWFLLSKFGGGIWRVSSFDSDRSNFTWEYVSQKLGRSRCKVPFLGHLWLFCQKSPLCQSSVAYWDTCESPLKTNFCDFPVKTNFCDFSVKTNFCDFPVKTNICLNLVQTNFCDFSVKTNFCPNLVQTNFCDFSVKTNICPNLVQTNFCTFLSVKKLVS